MSQEEIIGTAKVTLTVEVDVGGGTWGHDCTLEQVYKQAGEGAINKIQNMIIEEARRRGGGAVRITGPMKVDAIIVSRRRP